MSNITVNRLTNANIYMNGNSLLGRAEQIDLPEIKFKQSEHKALGMLGTVELFSGIEKLEGKVKWNSFYEDVYSTIANPFRRTDIQVRGSLEIYNSQGRIGQQPVVVFLTVQFKKVPTGNYRQHDNVEAESDFSATYIKMVINGQDKLEFDALSNIYKIDGVDVTSEYRANIGG